MAAGTILKTTFGTIFLWILGSIIIFGVMAILNAPWWLGAILYIVWLILVYGYFFDATNRRCTQR